MVAETSLGAYEELKGSLGERQRIVYNALEDFNREGLDATDFELAKYLEKEDPNFVRPRRYELVNKYKLVGFSQKRICGITGKRALAWKIVKRKFN